MSAWRPIGASGRYPDWMRALGGKSGAYAIRQRGWLGGTTVLYVGESHTGNLYKTLTRHFQSWSRSKSWWSGQFAPAQTDPGHTYQRSDAIEVMVLTTPAARAVKQQNLWIRAMKPRDNHVGVLEEAPF